MSSSKTKRTVTVETTSKSTSEGSVKSKPSVFDRLGAPHGFGSSERQEICLDFANTGSCSYGSKCKYAHISASSSSSSSRRDREKQKDKGSDDLRIHVSRKRDENEIEHEAKKLSSHKRDKDSKIKSAVVITKSTDNTDDIWPEHESEKSSDRKHETKAKPSGSSSFHATEPDGHKSSKLENRSATSDSKKDEASTSHSSSKKSKIPQSPSHGGGGDEDALRRKSKDKKKKKRNRSQGSRSPEKIEEKPDLKRQKDALPSSSSKSEKYSKSVSESKKSESLDHSAGVLLDKNFDKKSKAKDEESVASRLLMLAMPPEEKADSRRMVRGRSPAKTKRDPSPSSLGKGKDSRKDFDSSPTRIKDAHKIRDESLSKSRKTVKDQSDSQHRSKEPRRERSASPSRSKDRGGAKISHTKPENLAPPLLLPPPPVSGRVGNKSHQSYEEKSFDVQDQQESGSKKTEKGKPGRKRRHSSTSSSSSSSSSGSDSGSSSSGSSSSGSSSSSSSSSDDESPRQRKTSKDRRGKEVKHSGKKLEKKLIQPEVGKEKGGEKNKEKRVQSPHKASHVRKYAQEKDKKVEDTSTGKYGLEKKDLSPGQDRKKDWDKGSLRSGLDMFTDSRRGKAPSSDREKTIQDRLPTGESQRQKMSGSMEYSKKAKSPLGKDDRGKPSTPAELSRHGQSPTESLRSHHSTKPISLMPEHERDHDEQYRSYYSSRDKASRKEDDRYQHEPYPADYYIKKHEERKDSRSANYSSSLLKLHPSDLSDRVRDGGDLEREDQDTRYSRDHGYEGDRYAERHHAEHRDEVRSRQDYHSSTYHDERRGTRSNEAGRRESDRVAKPLPIYDSRDSEHGYSSRDRDRSHEQRSAEYREKTSREPVDRISSSKYKKDEGHVDDSRRERTSRRSHWDADREMDDQARITTGSSEQPRVYVDKRDTSRKRVLEDDGGSVRSPLAKKMREGSPSDSHHSFSSRTAFDRDSDRLEKERDRSGRSRNYAREEDRHSGHGDGEYREKDPLDRDRGIDKDWESSKRHDSKDLNKDSKIMAEGRDRGVEGKDAWRRDESNKRRRSPSEKPGDDRDGGWDRKRPRVEHEPAERDKPVDRSSRRDEEHRLSPTRDRSPKSSTYAYKQDRTESEKKSLDYVKLFDADVDARAVRLKSEEKRDVLSKDAEASLIPVHVDDRLRRSASRGSLGSKHSQRDRDSRRDDRHYEDRHDSYRDVHYRDERLPLPDRSFDHEDREAWIRDRSFDRSRPEDEAVRPFRGPYDHDRTERDLSKSRDFRENDWEIDSFRRDSLGYRGLPRPSNWERDRTREDWDNRYESEFRPRRDVLLPPPPRPRPGPEVRVPSPLPPPVETLVPPPPVELLPPAEAKLETVAAPAKAGRASKDDDTGYDDISDGELDDLIGIVEEDKEESQVGKSGVVDILDIKWESLIHDNRTKLSAFSSVLNRFSPAAIFRKIGVSRAFAGDELVNKVKAVCQKQLEDEVTESNEEKKEAEEKPSDAKMNEDQEKLAVEEQLNEAAAEKSEPLKCVEEPLPNPAKTSSSKFELLDDIADFHAGLYQKSVERAGVVNNIGPYRRALCARRDLAMRRGLCKVEREEILMFPTHVVDQDLYKQSLQLFHQDRTERKIPVASSMPFRAHAVQAA